MHIVPDTGRNVHLNVSANCTHQTSPARPKGRVLGTTATPFNSDTPQAVLEADKQARELRARTWRRQQVMWNITRIVALAGCHRWRSGFAADVSLQWGSDGSSKWGGLQNSHSVWGSPVAAMAIARQRIREATQAVENWHAAHPNGAYLLLTLTLPHDRTQSLGESLGALKAGWMGIIGTTTWGRDRERYGIHHWYKSLEITHGNNGWHPHNHILLFLDRALSGTELKALKARIFTRYARRLEKHGWARPNIEYGIDLVQVTDLEEGRKLAAYVSKGPTEAWDPAAEVAGGAFKSAKGTNRTPWEVLDSIGEATPGTKKYARDVAIWHEYEKVTRGLRQTAWSKGAREALQVEVLEDSAVETTDTLNDTQPDERYIVARIPGRAWTKALSKDVISRLDAVEYVAAATTALEAQRRAHVILTTLGIEHESVCLRIENAGKAWKVDTDGARSVLESV